MLKKPKVSTSRVLLGMFLSCSLATVLAQPKDNAPYSRFGLGEQIDHALSAAGFAGLTATYADPLYVNLENPASLGTLSAATFEVGLLGEYSRLDNRRQQAAFWTGNLNHLALAFPVFNRLNDALLKKKRELFWGMSIALVPHTSIGYDVESFTVDPVVDTVRNIFRGTGGTSRIVWGNGWRYKRFSAGINLSYLFGQLESERVVRFPDLAASFSDRFLDNISVRGFTWDLGFQYRFDFDEEEKGAPVYLGRSLIVGVYGNSPTGFRNTSTVYRIGEYMTPSEVVLTADTVYREIERSSEGTLPADFHIGLMYQRLGKYRIGVEYGLEAWSGYENEAKPDVLRDSRRLSAGIEYIPDIGSYNNYLRRIRYRAGFYHRTDPRLQDLSRFALTLGLGLPLILPRQQTSFVNLALEVGRYDTPTSVQETFLKIALGFSLNDNSWFFKRRFG